MEEAVKRLIRALHDPKTAKTMGQSRVREVIFEAITKSHKADALRALVVNQGRFSQIVHSLKTVTASIRSRGAN